MFLAAAVYNLMHACTHMHSFTSSPLFVPPQLFFTFAFSVNVCAEYIIMSSLLVISKLDVTTCCSRYDCQDSLAHLCCSCMFTIPMSLLFTPLPFPTLLSLGPLFFILPSLSHLLLISFASFLFLFLPHIY